MNNFRIEQTNDSGKTWEKVFENENSSLLLAQFIILTNNRDFLKTTKFRLIEEGPYGYYKKVNF